MPHSSEIWEVQDQCVSKFSSWGELSSWLVNSYVFTVFSHGRERALFLIFKDINSITRAPPL